MGDVIALRVDGDMVRINAQVLFHFCADIGLVVVVFGEDEVVADAIATAVFHHVASGMGQVHAIYGQALLLSHVDGYHVVVLTGTVVHIVDNGRFQVVENVPGCIVADPIRVCCHVLIADVVHVASGLLEGVSGTVFLTRGYDHIYLRAFRKLFD